jgi:hypothetical protein
MQSESTTAGLAAAIAATVRRFANRQQSLVEQGLGMPDRSECEKEHENNVANLADQHKTLEFTRDLWSANRLIWRTTTWRSSLGTEVKKFMERAKNHGASREQLGTPPMVGEGVVLKCVALLAFLAPFQYSSGNMHDFQGCQTVPLAPLKHAKFVTRGGCPYK